MKIYNYNRNTKEYISTSQATEDPLEKGKYLIPALATVVAISTNKDNFTQIFNEKKNVWEYIEDNRGKIVYNTISKQKSKVDYLGVIKSGFTELVPKINDKWDGTKWIFDTVIASKIKLQELETDYNNANEADINYMGTIFQADYKSQNLIANTLSTGSVPNDFYWLDKANKQIAMTYTQFQDLGKLLLARNQINFTKLQTLKKQVKDATTQSQLDKVQWS